MCLLVIALLTQPQSSAMGTRRGSNMFRYRALYRAEKSRPNAADGAQTPRSNLSNGRADASPTLPRLSLRGGGDLHTAEVDLGFGRKVSVKAYKDGNAVVSAFTATCDGFEVQWGVALGQMDAWVHPQTAQGGKYAALVPKGSRDHMGTAMRTPLSANTAVLIGTNNMGAQDDELWGVRFVIVEVTCDSCVADPPCVSMR
jgi:hypothetical protein